MKNIVILSGAGIDRESGILTFRDIDGLWYGYNPMEVASIDGWYSDKSKVLDFYNRRRADIVNIQPNSAHFGLARLEEKYNVNIITQNVSDLHERGGSSDVLHLHGSIFKMRGEYDRSHVVDYDKDINIGDLTPNGQQLRPDIVWFGEDVPNINYAVQLVNRADIFIVIGTSLNVYPAASLLDFVPPTAEKFIIDPSNIDLDGYDSEVVKDFVYIQKTATEGVDELLQILM